MKIAIASLGEEISSEISPQAGRAPFYLIFNNKKLEEVWKNPFNIGGGGAGFSVAKIIADKKVDKVIAGRIGDKMEDALRDKNISFLEVDGLIEEKLSQLF